MGQALHWHALDAARRQLRLRRPFVVDGERVGSVDRTHLGALEGRSHWLEVRESAVVLTAAADDREAVLAELNDQLRELGLIRGWRDEAFPLLSPSTGRVMAVFERASARFWGTLTLGAHCNGWVAAESGEPQWLWIARRSLTKATDPGKLDNLIGGGVPSGQTPLQALIREGFEEAGLQPQQMLAVQPAAIIELHRDVPEGLQFERLHAFDLELPAGLSPCNQDAEVSGIERMTLAQALDAASGPEMTVDAALVTLEFLLRQGAIAAGPARDALKRGLEQLQPGRST